jgi:phosphinothricin acetyltransferase
MIGGVDAENEASVALHVKLGFIHAGTIKQAGFKFNRWLDLSFYQLTLATPANPIDE